MSHSHTIALNVYITFNFQMDYPVPAGMKGSLMFLSGVTDEMRQVYRKQVFQVSKQDLVDVAAQ